MVDKANILSEEFIKQQKIRADKALLTAKEIEQNQLKKGYKYTRIGKTVYLKKLK